WIGAWRDEQPLPGALQPCFEFGFSRGGLSGRSPLHSDRLQELLLWRIHFATRPFHLHGSGGLPDRPSFRGSDRPNLGAPGVHGVLRGGLFACNRLALRPAASWRRLQGRGLRDKEVLQVLLSRLV